MQADTLNIKPYWPENMIFWGAGATADLGMVTTDQQGKMVAVLGRKKDSLLERVKIAFEGTRHASKIADFIKILGDSLDSDDYVYTEEEIEAGKRLYPKLALNELKKHIVHLRKTYDWAALKRIVEIIPQSINSSDADADTLTIRELFNILDMHIISGQGVYSRVEDNALGSEPRPYFIQHFRLRPARNCLIMLINLRFFLSYQELLEKTPSKIEPYRNFFIELAKTMQKEGVEKFKDPSDGLKREYYMFSYGITSMNFDPLLLWFIFCSHAEVNSNPPYIGLPPRPIKLFNDFAIFMGVRKIDSTSWEVKYPPNESVVQRINDAKYNCERSIRIGKFYLPHGCSSWRECQNCAKLTMHLGDEFDFYSKSLFPNPPIPGLGEAIPRTHKEKTLSNIHPDAITCAYCGTMTYASDTPMVMQSAYKGYHPPYIEEVQRDQKVCLENCNHVILMGYSLPPDDVIWRSVLAARKNRNPQKQVKCTVIVGYDGPDKWLHGKELENYINSPSKPGAPAIKSAAEIFELENIRAYTCGIPRVWSRSPNIKENLNKILTWDTSP